MKHESWPPCSGWPDFTPAVLQHWVLKRGFLSEYQKDSIQLVGTFSTQTLFSCSINQKCRGKAAALWALTPKLGAGEAGGWERFIHRVNSCAGSTVIKEGYNLHSNMQLSPNYSVPQVMKQFKVLVFIFLKYQRPQLELYHHVPRWVRPFLSLSAPLLLRCAWLWNDWAHFICQLTSPANGQRDNKWLINALRNE